ncbi:phasin family protein [Glaciimonas immobilis]|uniref:Phasin family protein n=1 Tax=Glaciimonas immobilis TaxID=728004 RepID=A0A840RPE9_9BURK|nr:phasin family protein [Glaciimonas immobilis]KAF3999787.1 phasin family protein [Glaciimonas immobilis]MBB5200257.1 phasin family protein [Glaciimonas immobilis]
MFILSEHLSSIIKANVEARHAIASKLKDKISERIEELTRLNLDVMKATLGESMGLARQLLDAKNPQEFFAVSATHVQREIQSAIYYGNEAMRINTTVKAECNQALAENMVEASRQGAGYLTEMTKNIPQGTDQVVGIVKSAWQKTTDAILKTASDVAVTSEAQTPTRAPADVEALQDDQDSERRRPVKPQAARKKNGPSQSRSNRTRH